RSPFKRMYLPAAAGDAGGAIGAAFVVWQGMRKMGDGRRGQQGASDFQLPTSNFQPNVRFVMRHAYTGPEFNDEEIEELVRARGLLVNTTVPAELAAATVSATSSASSSSLAEVTHH